MGPVQLGTVLSLSWAMYVQLGTVQYYPCHGPCTARHSIIIVMGPGPPNVEAYSERVQFFPSRREVFIENKFFSSNS